MSDELHQGWSNRETWAANLWFANHQPAAAALARAVTTRPRHEWGELAEQMAELSTDQFAEMLPGEMATILVDLAAAARARVNWQEIAETHARDREGAHPDQTKHEWIVGSIETLALAIPAREVVFTAWLTCADCGAAGSIGLGAVELGALLRDSSDFTLRIVWGGDENDADEDEV